MTHLVGNAGALAVRVRAHAGFLSCDSRDDVLPSAGHKVRRGEPLRQSQPEGDAPGGPVPFSQGITAWQMHQLS